MKPFTVKTKTSIEEELKEIQSRKASYEAAFKFFSKMHTLGYEKLEKNVEKLLPEELSISFSHPIATRRVYFKNYKNFHDTIDMQKWDGDKKQFVFSLERSLQQSKSCVENLTKQEEKLLHVLEQYEHLLPAVDKALETIEKCYEAIKNSELSSAILTEETLNRFSKISFYPH